MLWYILKLLILLPLIGGMIWGSLKLAQAMQAKMGAGIQGRGRSVRVVETMMLSPTQKLAVIEFRGREILVSSGRGGLTRLAEVPIGAGFAQSAQIAQGAQTAQSAQLGETYQWDGEQ